LYPNPAHSEISLIFSKPITRIEIIDGRGCIVLFSKEKTISILDLPMGMYFAKVTDENGNFNAYKFVKN
jgi:hypothetical protein